MADKIHIEKDHFNGDDYEPTDSDEYYSEEEKELLQKVRAGRKHEVERKKEIMPFDESEEDDEDDEDEDDDQAGDLMHDSDIEGADDNEGDLPDPMDWGKKSRNYYNTDFVDPDYDTYNAEQEEMAREEEEEAKRIQQRLLKQMQEKDFMPDYLFTKKPKEKVKSKKETSDTMEIKADMAGMSSDDKLLLFQEDSPEFLPLKQDFEQYMNEVNTLLVPVLNYVQEHKVPMIPALQFAKLYRDILLTYCNNVAFYLLLKAKRTTVRTHPVTQRLLQLKKLLEQLQDKYDNIIQPQMEALLERIVDGDKIEVMPVESVKVKKSKLSILNQFDTNENTAAVPVNDDEMGEDDDGADESDEEHAEEDEEAAEDARRGITYQIAKNKGLTPHRKKELRNPRVKHRAKFRKALIRRKGAVRTVRKELKRYDGEISGIKATVSKSIKFKV